MIFAKNLIYEANLCFSALIKYKIQGHGHSYFYWHAALPARLPFGKGQHTHGFFIAAAANSLHYSQISYVAAFIYNKFYIDFALCVGVLRA